MTTPSTDVKAVASQGYKYGWTTDVESEIAPKGLTEDMVRWISNKNRYSTSR